MAVGLPESAHEGYRTAVGLLPRVAWHGLDRSARERHLARWQGLAEDAAAAALEANHPEAAIALLEFGRTVLWTQRLHHRTDLDSLRHVDSELARRLDQLRFQLDRWTPGAEQLG